MRAMWRSTTRSIFTPTATALSPSIALARDERRNQREELTWKFSPTATLGESVAGLWKTKDFGDALYHIEASLASNLTAHSQLKLTALDDYKTKPPHAGIKKNDVSFIAAVVMKF
jgi:uncharacterized protein DUF481